MRFVLNVAAISRWILPVTQLGALLWIGAELHSIAKDTGRTDPAAQEAAAALQEISQRLGKIGEAIILTSH